MVSKVVSIRDYILSYISTIGNEKLPYLLFIQMKADTGCGMLAKRTRNRNKFTVRHILEYVVVHS